ncbi:MAG: hypothetical protein HQL71_03610, partial [Magnetococcales bacterium]|nr:hypothetical protein [Magnetococcales bacterium]
MHLISTEWRRIFQLVLIMAVVAMSVGGLSLYVLYETAFNEAKSRLTETAQSRARLMESVARFNEVHNKNYAQGSFHATLFQIRQAHDKFEGFGKTGEFTMAKLQDNKIVFVLSHRHNKTDKPKPVPFKNDEEYGHLAEPMRQALLGHSGTIVGNDYRAVVVLAAYEPVEVLNLGVVAKIDLAEIRQPFIEAGLILFVISAVVIGKGDLNVTRMLIPELRGE